MSFGKRKGGDHIYFGERLRLFSMRKQKPLLGYDSVNVRKRRSKNFNEEEKNT